MAIPIDVRVVLIPLAVVACELCWNKISMSSKSYTSDAIAVGIDALHGSLCLSEWVIDMPDTIQGITRCCNHLAFLETCEALDVHTYVVHPLTVASQEVLYAEHLVSHAIVPRTVCLSDGVPIACLIVVSPSIAA